MTPGRYLENLETVRGGGPGAPITITGPRSAVYSGGGDARSFEIKHSHVHLTGLTLNGLHDPDNPDVESSYRDKLVYCVPETPEYLTDVKITPHAVGNTTGEAIRLKMIYGAEVGDFEVIGPTGVSHYLFDESGSNGEVVYVGTSPSQLEKNPGGEVDRSHDVHVHHVDNSAGHVNSELVNTKEGTYDVLVEYCTGYGSAYIHGGEVNIQGERSTVRYCDLSHNAGAGIRLGVSTSHEDVPYAGEKNSVYYNRLLDNDGAALKLPTSDAEDQEVLCGNEYDGGTNDDPGKACPTYLPEPKGHVGHKGGQGN
ncbi:hypothetical protein HUG10_20280 (plasmid) [Halorarum halophilum]|uniref:Right handed beta helix domain-containing protein n=1 Tax=Halorarum halophilum TaxID=2743090 RepID=A0A7D5K3V6_9EURY|nr:hypothetical protein [Halobaculum halophilum]QLG29941.1 hypothetical protein HUG10_20280 [Halobaculum halophilum]